MLIKNGEMHPLDVNLWQNICNKVLAILDPDGKYKSINQGRTKNLAKTILCRYNRSKLNLLVDNTEYFDEKTKEAARRFEEELATIEVILRVNMRERPLAGDAAHLILGMGPCNKSGKILRCTGRKRVKKHIAYWTTDECIMPDADYEKYTIKIEHINYARMNKKSPITDKLPSEPESSTPAPIPKERSDEYYTKYEDVENELKDYKGHFRDAIIYCNCDDNKRSAFYWYFYTNFKALGLKKLITSCWYENPIIRDIKSVTELVDGVPVTKESILESGKFSSNELKETLNECDIVVSNPPFSQWGEFIELLDDYGKKFLFLGQLSSLNGNRAKNLFLSGNLWIGKTLRHKTPEFEVPSTAVDFDREENGKKYKKVDEVRWFTNLSFEPEYKSLELMEPYNPAINKKIDDYDAINVGIVKKIPNDYYGAMAVPLTYLDDHNENDFEILDILRNPSIEGEKKYTRIIIKRR